MRVLVGLLFAATVSAQDAAVWKRVHPTPAELAWRKVDWKPTFWEGIVEAHKEKKPILLWTMNGHPLGHT